jgi:hypothetical protein
MAAWMIQIRQRVLSPRTATLAQRAVSAERLLKPPIRSTISFVDIVGTFQGSASVPSFVTGVFSLSGVGDLYPFISLGGQLLGPPGVVAGVDDVFQLSASATNFLGPSISTTVTPLPGEPLPQELPSSLGNIVNGIFTGLGTLTVGITFSAAPAATYSFANSGPTVQASTDPVHVVPEPSTLIPLLTLGLAGWFRWWRLQ